MKVTPVPIPNTKVKLQCADGTAGVTLWKSRLSPGEKNTKFSLVVLFCVNIIRFIKIRGAFLKLLCWVLIILKNL